MNTTITLKMCRLEQHASIYDLQVLAFDLYLNLYDKKSYNSSIKN